MTQIYSDPTRENDPHALPDVEVFYMTRKSLIDNKPLKPGYYWWACFPGCLPDSEPYGPFKTFAEAVADARSMYGD